MTSHQLCDGGRVLWDCTVLGEVCHCKSHHNLLGSRVCNTSPGNQSIGVPCLAIPNCSPILSNLRKWTLDPLLFYALSVNSRTHWAYLQWKQWHSCCGHCTIITALQGCGTALSIACTELTTQSFTLYKTENLSGIWGRDSCNVRVDQPVAEAFVSCSDQWKVRDQDKDLCPIHRGMEFINFLCSREVCTGVRGVVMQHQRKGQLLGKGFVQVPVTYPTSPSQRSGRHQNQAAPPVPLSKHTWWSPCSPPSPSDERTFVASPSQPLDAPLVTSLPWYPSTWRQACCLWPVSQERTQTSLCIRQAAPEGKDIMHPWQCDCSLF